MKMTFWQKTKAVASDRRLLVILLLGFSSGLPLQLVGGTLQLWLTNAGMDVKNIGFFALVGLPYCLKFLWAPFLDGKPLPFLGLRRGWGIVCQLCLCVSVATLAFLNPVTQILPFSIVALMISFFSASQDIVVDAYRIEVLEKEWFGIGSAIANAGYRIAMALSGGLALILSDMISWKIVYLIMAGISLVGAITLLFAKEPTVVRPPRDLSLKAIFKAPFADFFSRTGGMEILIFVMIYKLSTLMATALTTTFLSREMQYTNSVIGAVSKGPGLVMSILGTAVGGTLMYSLGIKRSLWIFGLIQSLVGVTFWALIHTAKFEGAVRYVSLVTVIGMDQFMMGLGSAAIVGFMMSVSNLRYSGTQFAMLSSLPAFSRTVFVAYAGVFVEYLGWEVFFLSTVLLALPGLILLYRFDHWQKPVDHASSGFKWYEVAMFVVFGISIAALTTIPAWKGMGLDFVGDQVSYVGAIGVIGVILATLIIPLFTSRKLEAQ